MRLIDADALKERLVGVYENKTTATIIDEMPTVDAVPVVHGIWTTENSFEWHCSECEYEPLVFENTPYCPNCGARMNLENKHETD